MTTGAWDEQMKRWSEWHELIVVRCLSNETAIEEWSNKKTKSAHYYDISTVSKAVKQFEKLIKPIN